MLNLSVKLSPMADATLRMRDVCARTGLARSTIHHYIREGLLPRPEKTGRNTALYDEEFVRRAQLVKALQEKTHMPLATIRETLDGMPDVGAIDPQRFAGVTQTIANELRLASERTLSRDELLEATGFTTAELDGLLGARLVESEQDGTFSPLDARVAMAIARIRDAGATAEAGFGGSADIVRAYRKNLTEIARTEAQEMVRSMRSLAGLDIERFVHGMIEPLGELVAAMHHKALVRAISELTNGGNDGSS